MLLVVGAAVPALAHPARLVAGTVSIHRSGSFTVRLRFDLLALAVDDTPDAVSDDSMNALLDGPDAALDGSIEQATQRLLHGVVLLCGADRAAVRGDTIFCTTADEARRHRNDDRRVRLPIVGEATIVGQLPPDTRSVAVRFPEVLGSVVVTFERPGEEPYAEPIDPGRTSSTLPVRLGATLAAATNPTAPGLQSARPEDGPARFGSADGPARPPAAQAPAHLTATEPEPSHFRAAAKYLALGFEHIVPRGPDHILFVLGLFLLSTKLRPLLWQVSAFTLAHSITLALALYGVIRLPGIIVEPLIAASIAFVAVENLFTSELKPWRPLVVFGFGLVHGLGFAGAIMDTGLPRHQFATAVVTFNVGVELGQLFVIVLAFAAVGWWRRRAWYRGVIVVPTSCAIAMVAMFWTIQRIVG